MKDKKLTMGDIAKIAEVGKSTVSRYFNGGYVKEETRIKLKKIIDEYHYEPNAIAQSLKAKYSKTIGIVVPCLDSITTSRVLMAMDDDLKNQGYTSIIMNTNHDELRELTSIEQLSRMNVDGIILMATHVTMAHQKIASKLDIPLLFVAQKYALGYSIVNNDYQAGYDIGTYGATRGHKKVCYIGVSQKDEAVGIERKRGVVTGLKEHGAEMVDILEADFSFKKAYQKTLSYLDIKHPTLIICATDNIALGCLKAIQEKGLSVPEDISLMGFGGYEISSYMAPSLTTVRFDNEKTGQLASQTIVHLIEEKPVEQLQFIDYQINEGKSVKDIR
ncbi:MAG: LacI family DNA-binding transcriptional regulator [Coprobacillus sp.]